MATETYYANTQAHCTNRACLNHLHPRSDLHAQRTRIHFTRSIGFCVIWDFIIRSSSSLGSLGPKSRAFRSKLQMRDMGISQTWKPGYTIKLAAWGLKLNPEFQLSSEINFLTFNYFQPKHTRRYSYGPNTRVMCFMCSTGAAMYYILLL